MLRCDSRLKWRSSSSSLTSGSRGGCRAQDRCRQVRLAGAPLASGRAGAREAHGAPSRPRCLEDERLDDRQRCAAVGRSEGSPRPERRRRRRAGRRRPRSSTTLIGSTQAGDEACHVVVGRELGGGEEDHVAQLGVVALQQRAGDDAALAECRVAARRVAAMRSATSARRSRRSGAPRARRGDAAAACRACVMPSSATSRSPAGPTAVRYAVAARAHSAWLVQMLLAAFSRRMCCSRACRVST